MKPIQVSLQISYIQTGEDMNPKPLPSFWQWLTEVFLPYLDESVSKREC